MKMLDVALSWFLCVSLVLVFITGACRMYLDLHAVGDFKEGHNNEGKPVAVLFERMPVLPDRIIFDSLSPDMIGFQYDAFKMWGMHYPKCTVFSRQGIITDVLSVH